MRCSWSRVPDLARSESARVRSSVWRRCGLLAAVLSLSAALTPAAASAKSVQGAAAIGLLNTQRAANGIASVTDNQRFATAWCPNEDHGPSGGESGRDLSPFTSWTRTSSPWSSAPLHQQDLYDPMFQQEGDVIVGSQSCLGGGDPIAQPASPTYAYFTGEGGHNATPYREVVPGESPYAPNQAVGLKLGKPTGPNLILYADGFPAEYEPSTGMQLTSWTLKTSSGTVVTGVKKLDYGTAAEYGYPGSISPDVAILIPPVLKPKTQYLGTATWKGPQGQTGTQTFTFKTVPAPGRVKVLTHGTVRLSHGSVKVRMSCRGGTCRGHALLNSLGFVLAEKSLTLHSGQTTTISFRVSRTFLAKIAPSPAPALAGFISGPQNSPTVSVRKLRIKY